MTNNLQLEKYTNYTQDQEDKYKKDTVFSVQEQFFSEDDTGTIKITESLAQQASLAMEKRIDATKDYTQQRIATINNNYKLAEMKFPQSESDDNIQNGETHNICHDWADDLFTSFYDLESSLQVYDPGDTLEEFIIQNLELKVIDQEHKYKQLFANTKVNTDTNAVEVFRKLVGDKAIGKDWFYIKKMDAVKGLIKNELVNSGYKNNLEDFVWKGILSGQFCFKEEWGEVPKHKIKTKGKGKGGKYTYELEKEPHYLFKPKDTRNLIFRKDKIEWVIEKVDSYKFSDILNMVLDDNGKPKKDAPYDYDMLKKVEKELKVKTREADENEKNNEKSDLQDSYDIDGDIIIYEGIQIPLNIDKKTKVCLITTIFVNGKYITIGIKDSPYYELSYKFFNMFKKDGDVAGYGIPEVLMDLQESMDDFQNFIIQILKFSLYGIFFYDEEKITNPNDIKHMQPGDGVALKAMDGANINSAIQWFNGNLTTLTYAIETFKMLGDMMSTISRKGPAGKKIQPNPSATEISIMTQELEKAVNRVVLRGGLVLEKMLENMYKYTILNRNDKLVLKVKTTREKPIPADQDTAKQKEKKLNELISEIDRCVELEVKDLFVEDLEFKVSGLDKVQKQAVERQQAMQFMNLLSANGYLAPVQNPDGTMSKRTIQDETGTKYEVNEHKLLTDIGRKLNVKDFLVRSQVDQQPSPSPALPPSSVGGGSGGVPPLSASPETSDILGGAMQQ